MVWALNLKGQYDEAIKETRKAMQLDPKITWGHEHLAWSLDLKGQYDQAIAEAREAIQQNPNDAWAHERLAWALNAQGKPAEGEAGSAQGRPA